MFGQVSTVAFSGIEARAVTAQVQMSPGRAKFAIVGLPDKAVAESAERVRGALHAVGLGLPKRRHITVNLAPADLPKEGTHYDLPIALAMLIAFGVIPQDMTDQYCAIGELALDGSIADVLGGLPAAIGANAMGKGLICPKNNGSEAAWASSDLDIIAPTDLLSLINHLKGHQTLSRPEAAAFEDSGLGIDICEIRGQENAKRALEVAAAGGHNMLMVGPPGSGKSMLAQRMATILPPMTSKEMLEVSMIRSMAGDLVERGFQVERPFRAPHHSASMAALVGGGVRPRPGEVALAHHGVLFLDELPEFSVQVLDSLRQPLETGEIAIARANHRVTYPSSIQLVAAMNPCKCGKAYDPEFVCRTGRNCVDRYLSRISGPLLDRIDIQIEVPAVSAVDLAAPPASETSADVRARVVAARSRQIERCEQHGLDRFITNAQCKGQMLDEMAPLSDDAKTLLVGASQSLGLTARGYHRVVRLARTLADLDGADILGRVHVAEALSYRGEAQRVSQAA